MFRMTRSPIRKALATIIILNIVLTVFVFGTNTSSAAEIPLNENSTTKQCSASENTEVKPGTPTFARVTEQIEKTPEFTAMTNRAAETDATVELLAINVAEDTSTAVVTYRASGEVDGFVTNFWIDYDANKLLAVQQYFAQQLAKDLVNFRVVVNDEEILNIHINSDHNVIMSDGTEIYYVDYIEQLEAENSISGGRGLCEWAMAALCGVGAGAACYGLCGIAAIVNVLGGLGCAIACGLIGGLGCAAATCAVCGGC